MPSPISDHMSSWAVANSWAGSSAYRSIPRQPRGHPVGKVAVRLRHASGRPGPLPGGQTEILFMDTALVPRVTADRGPPGMLSGRIPQVRVTLHDRDGLTLALAGEHALDGVDSGAIRPIDGDLAANPRGRNRIADVTFHARCGEAWRHVQLAGIVWNVGDKTRGTIDKEPTGSEIGRGVTATGVCTPGIPTCGDVNRSNRSSSPLGQSPIPADRTGFQTGKAFNADHYASGKLL